MAGLGVFKASELTPASLKQLLDALHVLRRRIHARATTRGTDPRPGAGGALRQSRRDVYVDAGTIAPRASAVAHQGTFGAIGTAVGPLLHTVPVYRTIRLRFSASQLYRPARFFAR